MTTKLAEYCRTQRFAQHLSLGDLAKRLGSKNISNTAGRVDRFEKEGHIEADLLDAIVVVLKLDPVVIQHLIEQDHEDFLDEWNTWADQPIRPYLVAKLLPGVYAYVGIPDEMLSPAAAETFAVRHARENRRLVCLVVSRRVSIWVRSDGTVAKRIEARPGERALPFMTVRGEDKPFILDFDGDGQRRRV